PAPPIAPNESRSGALGEASCRAGERRYADYTVQLTGGAGYLIVVGERRDTARAHPRRHRFDAALRSPAPALDLLLDGSTYEVGAPPRTISQLLFIAPSSGPYVVRVSGHEANDRGAYTIAVRRCGGGTLPLQVTRRGALTSASCLEQVSFQGDSGYADLWSVHLDPQQGVVIRATASSGSPLYLRVVGPGLATREGDSDIGRLRFTARDGGTYTIVVAARSLSPGRRPYTIRVDKRRY
ncbi:MAG: hypothetical protein IRY91_16380, partial [Gemmatimonadaceae bacterium]|nr:hypothetical protein [Gemmatimonadaceae bacterium]